MPEAEVAGYGEGGHHQEQEDPESNKQFLTKCQIHRKNSPSRIGEYKSQVQEGPKDYPTFGTKFCYILFRPLLRSL